VLLLSAAGCDFPGKPDPKHRPQPAEWVLDFTKLFDAHCRGCHGVDGKKGPAPPLNEPLFRALIPESEIEKVLNEGRHGTPMPAFAVAGGGTLTPAQVQVLVYEIKGIAYRIEGEPGEKTRATVIADPQGNMQPKWGMPPPLPEGTPPYLAPAGTLGDVERGRTEFARSCAQCHGQDGKGGKKGAVNEPAFLALMSDQAIRRILITGREDLKMPGAAELALSAEEIADLGALLAAWRQESAAGQ
jgi:mono/diheme cytochrome c family protein